MKRKILLPLLLLCSALLPPAALAKDSDKKHAAEADLKTQAKVTETEAQKIALAKAPGGKIQSGELEEEKGALIWSFDIAMPGTKDITEVAVDAKTGAIVSVVTETPKEQKKERKEDKKEHKKHEKKEKDDDEKDEMK